jgi:uncharacterized protein (TIGR00725 family)
MKKTIGIIGGHQHNTTSGALLLAEHVGAELARRGFAIICGGYDGIMEATCRGCKEAGGTTIGVLKGNDPSRANPYIDYVIATSMDLASNHLIIWSPQGIIAFDGMYGTLNEIALALDTGKPLISLGQHRLLNITNVDSTRFAHFEGYDFTQIPKAIDCLDALLR